MQERRQRKDELRARRRQRAVVSGAVLSVGVGMVGGALPAAAAEEAAQPAATFTVTNTDDAGAGSLRQAILDANSNPGHDTITFGGGATGQITLSTGQLEITDSVSILGPGAQTLAVSGNDASRVFYMWNSLSTIDVSISGLTIRDGNAADGAGIAAWGENLTLADVVVTGNVAAGDGGGVLFYGNESQASLSISDSEISGNNASYNGGGLYSWSADSITLTNVAVTGNTSGSDGGGVSLSTYYASEVAFTLTDSTVSDNYGGDDGGGLFLYGAGPATISNVSITGNEAGDDGGGALFYDGGEITVENSTISGNTADSDGGGAFFYENQGAISITNTQVTGNHATYGDGGGLRFYETGDVEVSGSVISGNSAEGDGGGAHFYNSYYGAGVTITDTQVVDNDAGYDGGGLFLYDLGDVTIVTSTVADNTAEYGGGIFAEDLAGLEVSRSTISGNAAGLGGGLFATSGSYYSYAPGAMPVVVENSTVSGNSSEYIGGGIALTGYVQGAVRHTTVSGNTAEVAGGGVVVPYGAEAVIEHTILANGSASFGPDLAAQDPDAVTVSWSLIEQVDDDTLFTDGGGNVLEVDPKLGALRSNGGTTQTHLPQSYSPVIDAGDPEFSPPPSSDQRGKDRVVGGRVDIGSVEWVRPPADVPPPSDGSVSEPVPPASSPDEPVTVVVDTPAGQVVVTVVGAAEGAEVVVTPRMVDEMEADDRGFRLLDQAFDVEVTGGSVVSARVCLPYDEAAVEAAGLSEEDLELFHFPSPEVREVATASVDTDVNQVCGDVSSFSPFALGVLGTERLAGVNAFETAAAISADTFAEGAGTVFLATREAFADVLGAGPAAASSGAPILLTSRDTLPEATGAELVRLGAERVVIVGGTAAVSSAVQEQVAALVATVDRVAGLDRYETAAALSAATFAPEAPVAYVATGERFPDGLVAGAAAAADGGGPVLLTRGVSLPEATRAELERLAPQRIVLVGGTAAVSDAVQAELEQLTTGGVTRLAGVDRYETAAQVATGVFDSGTPAFVATGAAPWDALAGVPAAAAAGGALLLVAPTGVPAAVADALTEVAPPAISVLGGTAVISKETEADIAGFLPEV